jgi:hypothetical protein
MEKVEMFLSADELEFLKTTLLNRYFSLDDNVKSCDFSIRLLKETINRAIFLGLDFDSVKTELDGVFSRRYKYVEERSVCFNILNHLGINLD